MEVLLYTRISNWSKKYTGPQNNLWVFYMQQKVKKEVYSRNNFTSSCIIYCITWHNSHIFSPLSFIIKILVHGFILRFIKTVCHISTNNRFLSTMTTKDSFFSFKLKHSMHLIKNSCELIPAHYAPLARHKVSPIAFTWLLGYMTDHVTITPAKVCQIWFLSTALPFFTSHCPYQIFVMKFLTDAVLHA
jgi:hypothetical protein